MPQQSSRPRLVGARVRERPARPGADPEKRSRILKAAILIFGRRGFHEARVAEIARAAGVADGTVYLYFENKEDLLGCIFDETMDAALARMRQILEADGPACDRLTRMVDLHLTLLSSDRALASVFQIELRRSARLVERFSRSKLGEYLKILESIVQEGVDKEELRKDLEPRLAVRMIFGAIDEILSEWLLSGAAIPIADGPRLVGTLLRGFGSGKSPLPKPARPTTP
jgi:TetR/AcrR family fatty acid metabolism transcriptional regulator